VELLKDVAVRITPLTDADAAEMVRSLATYPLLDGYRDAPRADVVALEDLLLRVSALVDAHPTIAELDCNPVRVLPDGVVVVDARVRVEAATPPLPLAARDERPWGPVRCLATVPGNDEGGTNECLRPAAPRAVHRPVGREPGRGGRPHELVLSMPDLLDADTWSAAGPPNQTAAKRFLRSSRG
jgi:ATP-grasp domain